MKTTPSAIEIYLLRKKIINEKYLVNQKQYNNKKKSLNSKDKMIKDYLDILSLLKNGNFTEIQNISNELKEINIKLENGVSVDFLINN